jgi:hypothetical protein
MTGVDKEKLVMMFDNDTSLKQTVPCNNMSSPEMFLLSPLRNSSRTIFVPFKVQLVRIVIHVLWVFHALMQVLKMQLGLLL